MVEMRILVGWMDSYWILIASWSLSLKASLLPKDAVMIRGSSTVKHATLSLAWCMIQSCEAMAVKLFGILGT